MKGQLVELVPLVDAADYRLLAGWSASSPGVYSSGAPQFVSPDELPALIRGQGMNFLMVRTREGQTIGAVNWQPMTYAGSYTLGNVIGDHALWGLGYGVESVTLLLEYLFHAQNAHRVHLLTGAYNRPMVQIFTQGIVHIEGVLRDYFFLDGQYHDAIVGSILRDEYYSLMRRHGMAPTDVIPEEEKHDARQMLRKHLAENPLGA